MKLLSIAVPTYNRNEALSRLCHAFLFKVAQDFGDQVEIVVCDNSDQQQAEINECLLKEHPISYFKNPVNLGFAGNVLECVRKASAYYLWIISDDDATDFSVFPRMLELLARQRVLHADLIMLPYFQASADSELSLKNTQAEWNVGAETTLDHLVRQGVGLPFVLFSSAIISLNKRTPELLNRVETDFKGNDYFHIALYLLLSGVDAKVVFHDEPLQKYCPDFEGRFPLMGMVKSMDAVSDLIIERLGIQMDRLKGAQYRGWLIWLLHHRMGRCRIESADAGKRYLMRKIWQYPNPKNIFLWLLNVAPLSLTRLVYTRLFE